MRQASQNALDLIRNREAYRLTVYLDSEGLPTVGEGHLVLPSDNLKLGDVITAERADKFLEQDLAEAESCVNRHCSDLTQHQFDALISFTFNEGCGNLAQLVDNADDVPAVIADHFSHYTRAGTDHPRGLRIRRLLERDLFLTPDDVAMATGWLNAHDGIA